MKKLIYSFICIIILTTTAQVGAQEKDTQKDPAITDLPYQKSSPIVAGALSIVPGLGQMYNEQYAMGGFILAAEIGLYLAAASYAGVFDSGRKNEISHESIFLLAVAGGIHLFSIFDASLESIRRNETLDKWSVMVDPDRNSFYVAYQARF
jgi:hypothetical protein